MTGKLASYYRRAGEASTDARSPLQVVCLYRDPRIRPGAAWKNQSLHHPPVASPSSQLSVKGVYTLDRETQKARHVAPCHAGSA